MAGRVTTIGNNYYYPATGVGFQVHNRLKHRVVKRGCAVRFPEILNRPLQTANVASHRLRELDVGRNRVNRGLIDRAHDVLKRSEERRCRERGGEKVGGG